MVAAPGRPSRRASSSAPTCSGRGSPHMRSRQLTPISLATTSSSAILLVRRCPSAQIVAPRRGDDHGRRRAEPSRLRELALQRAARVVGVAAMPGARSSASHAATSSRGASGLEREEDVDRRRLGRRHALLLQREQEPLDPGSEPDARASAGRRSPRRGRRSGHRPRSSRSRSRAARRTPRSSASSSRARARGSGRACTRRRGVEVRRTAAKCSTHASQSDSPIVGASPSAARTASGFAWSCRRREGARRGLLARRPRRAETSCSASHAREALEIGGSALRQPIELSSSW